VSKPVNKLAYRPVGLVLGMAAGALAGAIFHQVWKMAAGDDEAPSAIDEDRGWGEVLAAAALQGAIFAVVRAAVDRGGATYGDSPATGRPDPAGPPRVPGGVTDVDQPVQVNAGLRQPPSSPFEARHEGMNGRSGHMSETFVR
jgi:hypothetical protein